MRKIAYILLLFLLTLNSKATNQIEDVLHYGQEKLNLYDSPLEQIDSIISRIYSIRESSYYSTDCHRGFRAEWIVIDNELHLQNVYECNSNINLNSTIEQITGYKFKNGLLKANWVNGVFWAGKTSVLSQTYFISIYEQEYKFNLHEGKLTKKFISDYPKCDYTNEFVLNSFVYNNIDAKVYDSMMEKGVKLTAFVNGNSLGEIIDVTITSTTNMDFNDEFIRILKKLPCVKVYYHEGVFWNACEEVHITINAEKYEYDNKE